MSGFASWRARRHRALYWASVLVAVVAFVGGGIVALVNYAATAGPDGAVKGYFAALERGDASAALGFGDLPAGPNTLLTGAVLREQLTIAPITDVHIVSTAQTGSRASVDVTYHLDFPDGQHVISDTVIVTERHGSWRLSPTAIAVRLQLTQAADRARILDTPVPSGTVLLFPGAVPITFDDPYLQLDPATASVQLDGPLTRDLFVEVTPQGKAAIQSALTAALAPCLAGPPAAQPQCPMPNDRTVPDSLRGVLQGGVSASTTVGNQAAGVIDVSAAVQVSGTYQQLNFNDIPVDEHGTVSVAVRASVYAAAPLKLTWQDALG